MNHVDGFVRGYCQSDKARAMTRGEALVSPTRLMQPQYGKSTKSVKYKLENYLWAEILIIHYLVLT